MDNKKIYLVTELTEQPQQEAAPSASANKHPRFTRLPNPEIPHEEYCLVSSYCDGQPNMTRQDWIELAIIEKLHNDHLMTDSRYEVRRNEIVNRPPRGQRKNTKNKTNK